MKSTICLCTLALCLGVALPAVAQERAKPATTLTNDSLLESMPSFASHPEMWLYLQEQKRYDDPRAAVRRNAEFRADQRQARLAAQKWFGYSNARPMASPTPIMGSYAPGWNGNSYIPGEWKGVGPTNTTVAVEVDARDVRR